MGKRDYIGSTAAADICGCGFNTPLELYQNLTGIAPEKPASEEMLAGLYLEDGLREMFQDKTGTKVSIGKEFQHWTHETYPFIQGTDDGMINPEEGLELKLVGLWQQKEFCRELDKVPVKYLLQCQHNMMTGRRKRFLLAAFFVSKMEMTIFPIERDAELCDDLLKHELNFWHNHVEKKIAPKEKDPEIVREYLSRKYKWHEHESMLLATQELQKLAYTLATTRHELKRLDAEKESIQNQFRVCIGNDSGIQFQDGESYITWNKSKDSFKQDWAKAFRKLLSIANSDYRQDRKIPDNLVAEILKETEETVPGSRRFLVKGPLFEGDPVLSDMRAAAVEQEKKP